MQVERFGGRVAFEVAVMLAAAVSGGCVQSPAVVVHTAGGGEVRVRVEVADTQAERSRGLMYRRDLAEDAGMLFVFPRDERHAFWMKNTPLSLDMIFIGADGRIVGVAPDAVPFSTKPVRVKRPSRYVLEVNAGFAARHGLAPDDRVEFRNLHLPGNES